MIAILEPRQRPRLGLRPRELQRQGLITAEHLLHDPELGGQLTDAEIRMLVARLDRPRWPEWRPIAS